MKSILTVAFVAISILSSCQQTPETKKVHDHKKNDTKTRRKSGERRRPNLRNENGSVFKRHCCL